LAATIAAIASDVLLILRNLLILRGGHAFPAYRLTRLFSISYERRNENKSENMSDESFHGIEHGKHESGIALRGLLFISNFGSCLIGFLISPS
jgi:hypothetical protein